MHFDTHNTGASAEKYKKIAFIIGKRDGNNRCSIANRKAPSLKVSKVSIHHQEHHLLENTNA
jgi:hypothetical protein